MRWMDGQHSRRTTKLNNVCARVSENKNEGVFIVVFSQDALQYSLARGTFGRVFVCKKDDGSMCALKLSKQTELTAARTEKRTFDLLSKYHKKARFQLIVAYMEGFEKKLDNVDHLCLITAIGGPSLEHILENYANDGFSKPYVAAIGFQLFEAVSCLCQHIIPRESLFLFGQRKVFEDFRNFCSFAWKNYGKKLIYGTSQF